MNPEPSGQPGFENVFTLLDTTEFDFAFATKTIVRDARKKKDVPPQNGSPETDRRAENHDESTES